VPVTEYCTMKFRTLLQRHPWPEVQATFERLFPDDVADIPAYAVVFTQLHQLEPKPCDLRLVIEEIDDPIHHTERPSVAGTNDAHRYAIEFLKWEEWLAMDVDQATLARYTEAEIIKDYSDLG
jgi:hypothetical protein